MSKIDLVFVLIGIFCYFSTIMRLRYQDVRLAQYVENQKKKQAYASHMIDLKRRESLAKAAEERKSRRKLDFQQMQNTIELLSNMSDEEVMRKSRVTNGKY